MIYHFRKSDVIITKMDLSDYNPWWNTGGLWQDRDLSRVKNSPLVYRPQVFTAADCLPATVYTLRGPRRAGKTVSLKLFVASLIEDEGWDPRQILWSNLETTKNMGAFEAHLDALMKDQSPRLLVFDEVTSVLGWQRVIKKAVDGGRFGNTTLILTGSSAYDLKKGAERMAGRRGTYASPDRTLLPMGFAQWKTQVEGRGVSARIEDYFIVGGFPFRVEEYLRQQGAATTLAQTTQVFDDIIAYEFNRRKLDRSIALEVLGRLAETQPHAISYEAFSKSLSVSRETARKYLDALGDAYLLMTLSSFDTGRGRPAPRKDRKFHWIDPSLAHLASWLGVGRGPSPEAQAEAVVGAALLRVVERQLWEGLSAPRQLFTWKSKAGSELDFLWADRSVKTRFPVEVKYQESISDWDFQSMERGFGCGLLVTKSTGRQREKSAACSLEEFLSDPQRFLSNPTRHAG